MSWLSFLHVCNRLHPLVIVWNVLHKVKDHPCSTRVKVTLMTGSMMNFPLTLGAILERAGQYFGQREIVSRLPDRSIVRYTYRDFHRRARQLASALARAGLQRGDRVATLMWNHHVHLEAYLGIP